MDKPNDAKVVIIGAGPAGLTAAYQLARAGVESIVLEKDRIVGGISKTVNYKDYYFDIGGHRFFTKSKAVNDMWHELLGTHLLRRNRLSRIYYNRRFFFYPLRPFNALKGLGVLKSARIMTSYLYSQAFSRKEEVSFEDWASNRFGQYLYSIFFKGYTEKVWGIPCTEIAAEWAAQRIKGLSLASALKNALIKSQNGDKRKVVSTLIDEFDYPERGPGMMWETVAENFHGIHGSRLVLDAEVEKIHWKGEKVEAVEATVEGKRSLFKGSDFISSMPVRELVQKLDPAVPEELQRGAEKLRYRDFLIVALILGRKEVFPDNWIYIHDPDVHVGRIQNFKNWSPHMVPDQEKTCLGLEYFCFEGDALWNLSDEQLIELAKKEVEKLGLARAGEVEDGRVVRMPKAYPVYDDQYRQSLQEIRGFLSGISNLQLVGRNGMHRYNNQDHSMLTAMLAVENIFGAHHDLWQVNTEQEYHEEVLSSREDDENVDLLIKKTFGRMDKLGMAGAMGIATGVMAFVLTFWLSGREGPAELIHGLLAQYFWGYRSGVAGSFLAMTYSFLWAFLFGWLFAYLRNFFTGFYIYRLKKKLERISLREFFDHF